MKKIVALGGGHGLSTVIKSLHHSDADLTAIVSVADDGGSSGRLRHDLDIVAPGDVRLCMLALKEDNTSRSSDIFSDIFGYRFDQGELDGHSLGNLILVALARQLGSFDLAVKAAAELLEVKGKILPATESSVVLTAQTDQGFVRGQVQIEQCSGIEKVFIEPADALPLAGVIESIMEADHIVYAPGSLFTSVIPVLIIPQISDALKNASADLTMVMNLSNRGLDTKGMTGDQHLQAVISHGGRVDRVICDEDGLKVENSLGDVKVLTQHLSHGEDFHDIELLGDTFKKLFDI